MVANVKNLVDWLNLMIGLFHRCIFVNASISQCGGVTDLQVENSNFHFLIRFSLELSSEMANASQGVMIWKAPKIMDLVSKRLH